MEQSNDAVFVSGVKSAIEEVEVEYAPVVAGKFAVPKDNRSGTERYDSLYDIYLFELES